MTAPPDQALVAVLSEGHKRVTVTLIKRGRFAGKWLLSREAMHTPLLREPFILDPSPAQPNAGPSADGGKGGTG